MRVFVQSLTVFRVTVICCEKRLRQTIVFARLFVILYCAKSVTFQLNLQLLLKQ